MRITTWNVNSLNARQAHFDRFLAEVAPDVVCLQETKLTDDRFPAEHLASLGYPHVVFTGQKSYNGVALVSRHPISDPQTGFFEGEDHPDRRIVGGVVNGIRIYGLYCPNGTKVGSPRYFGKLDWFRRLRTELDARFRSTDDVLITGDFNITPTDNDCWDPFRSEGSLLCTEAEREVFEHLLEFGLTDAWRSLNPFSVDFTWWDYRNMGFPRNQGLRIDHFLLTPSLMNQCNDVEIHKDVRGWDTPSDHAPVTATLDR